ncbi:MAG TPA: serine/threonine-protein kinase [Polyangiaceae bacterium LLY-WYZ-14_1]|nr:serine/threonine-protein kinase [Polyangiaceae bacterium LLY-WYZ-14_1]
MVAFAAPPGLEPIGRLGRYELLGRLAVGGMAEIFLAREVGPQAMSREVAIKRVLPHVAADTRFREMFKQEARLVWRLRHPHICATYDHGEEADGSLYLVMEWVFGVSLRALIEKAKPYGGLPPAIAAKICADVAGALAHAHAATDDRGQALEVVHRDVTPENVMVGHDGVVKLLDFGVAKAKSQSRTTRAGELKGKFAYMSPEQYRGDPLDGRSDVFSLGLCLYEAVTATAPYDRGSEYETVAAIVLDQNVPSLRDARSDLDPMVDGLDYIVRKMLKKDRGDRYESAEAVRQDIVGWLAHNRCAVQDDHIRRLVERLFPGEKARGPELERNLQLFGLRPEGQQLTKPIRRLETESREALGEMERLELTAELDQDEAKLARAASRKKLVIGALAGALVVGLLVRVVLALTAAPATDPATVVAPPEATPAASNDPPSR